MSMSNAQLKAANASLTEKLAAVTAEIEALKAAPPAQPAPLKLTHIAEVVADGSDVPDGTAENRVRAAIERLGEAIAALVGDDSNGDVHAITGALSALSDRFEGTSYAFGGKPEPDLEPEGEGEAAE